MMLEIKDLTKMYGSFVAVNHLNLSIEKGEIFGFVGPNGAGKTTTMRIICGLLQATSGEVYIDGIDALKYPEKIKRKVGYVPDYFGVYDNLTVMEYMEFFGSMYGIDHDTVIETSEGLLELVNLSDKKDAYVDGLSRGMKQRLCVARALIHNPDLLIMDEPNSGLDPRARYEMKEILKNLGSMGKTILISSHILPELSELCTSVGIMEKGSLVVDGNVEKMTQASVELKPLHIEIYSGKDIAVKLLRENPLVEKISIREGLLMVTYHGTEENLGELLSQLVSAGVMITGYYREKGNLENLFLEMTNHSKGVTR